VHAFGGFTLGLALRELYLGGCQLRRLPLSLVRDLVALRSLHLWANEIEVLPAGMFNQPGGGGRNLVELSLWGNNLKIGLYAGVSVVLKYLVISHNTQCRLLYISAVRNI